MPQAAVTTEVHQTFNVHCHFTTQVAFNRKRTDLCTDTLDFGIGQVTDLGVRGDPNGLANIQRTGPAHTIYVGQSHPCVFLNRYIDSSNTSHVINSCQLNAAKVNSTLYLIQVVCKSLNFLAFKTGVNNFSALSLLVLFLSANHEQHALAPDDFAVPADLFNRCLHFHLSSPKQAGRPC
jgi:hypothetical protein